METLRTPDSCFEGLPGYGFAPHYADIPDLDGGSLRVHYLDEGPTDGATVLLLHGEPSWSYLYRHMVPVLTGAGLRVIAPDLVGFGRSDKPTPRAEYTFARHVEWVRSLVFDGLDLTEVNLVCQDWGGLIGLRLVAEHPDRFARVVCANTFLPTGDGTPTEAFLAWLKFSQEVEVFPTGAIVNMGCTSELTPDIVAAYDAPFPEQIYAEGARQFPTLVPVSPDDPAAAANRSGLEGARDVREAVPHRLQRRGPHHRRVRSDPPGPDPGGQRPGSHHHRRRRSLPPRGQRSRTGGRGGRLHPHHVGTPGGTAGGGRVVVHGATRLGGGPTRAVVGQFGIRRPTARRWITSQTKAASSKIPTGIPICQASAVAAEVTVNAKISGESNSRRLPNCRNLWGS